jgi:TPP-dependent pyruvate/acetoin dehydrogenase alpha subunit
LSTIPADSDNEYGVGKAARDQARENRADARSAARSPTSVNADGRSPVSTRAAVASASAGAVYIP